MGQFGEELKVEEGMSLRRNKCGGKQGVKGIKGQLDVNSVLVGTSVCF